MLDNPAIIAVVIPMVIALIVAAASRAAGQGGPAAHILSLGGFAGFLTAYLLLVGWPEGMPRTATQKLGYIAIAGLIAGALLDVAGRSGPAARAVFILPAAAVSWIVAPQALRFIGDAARGIADWAPMIAAIILAFAVLWHLTRPESGLRDGRLAQLIAACLGLAGVCIMGSAASLGMLALAVAAAGAGVALWNLGRRRVAPGAGLVLALGAVLTGLGVQAALFTRAEPIALVVLLACFFTDAVPAFRPMATTDRGFRILAAAPPYILAVAAVGASLLLGSGGGYGY
jgi:hypothetical protein